MRKGLSFAMKVLLSLVMAAVVILLVSTVANEQTGNLIDFSGNSTGGGWWSD